MRWEVKRLCFPAEHFAKLEPQNLTVKVSEQHQIQGSTYFQTSIL